jgi:hypothetical protein
MSRLRVLSQDSCKHSMSVSNYFEWHERLSKHRGFIGGCESRAKASSLGDMSCGKHGYSFVISSLLFHCSSSSAWAANYSKEPATFPVPETSKNASQLRQALKFL